jgi:hypothetical protein
MIGLGYSLWRTTRASATTQPVGGADPRIAVAGAE